MLECLSGSLDLFDSGGEGLADGSHLVRKGGLREVHADALGAEGQRTERVAAEVGQRLLRVIITIHFNRILYATQTQNLPFSQLDGLLHLLMVLRAEAN